MPDLQFGAIDAEVLSYAAAPTILFKLPIRNDTEGEEIHSIMLRAQIRLEVTRRHYNPETEARLLELFGPPERWGQTLHSMVWTHATTVVPRFTTSTVAEVPVVCSFDFEVAASKYFYALEDGEIPLIFLFSGTVFYAGGGGPLQIAQIPWEKEAQYRLPVRVWKEMMDHYFPNSAWLRVRKDVFDRLYAFKARRGLPTWEATLEDLLQSREVEAERETWTR
ncbi:MAG: DUF6084 family protein [Chloroflexota bacterium]